MTVPESPAAGSPSPNDLHPPLTWASTRVVFFRVLIIGGLALVAGTAAMGWAEGITNRQSLANLVAERARLMSTEGKYSFRRVPVKRDVRIGALGWHAERVEARLAGQWTPTDGFFWTIALGLVMIAGGEAARRSARRRLLPQ